MVPGIRRQDGGADDGVPLPVRQGAPHGMATEDVYQGEIILDGTSVARHLEGVQEGGRGEGPSWHLASVVRTEERTQTYFGPYVEEHRTA